MEVTKERGRVGGLSCFLPCCALRARSGAAQRSLRWHQASWAPYKLCHRNGLQLLSPPPPFLPFRMPLP
eukprot:147002-Chlamydomonas_euryale.AAC.3